MGKKQYFVNPQQGALRASGAHFIKWAALQTSRLSVGISFVVLGALFWFCYFLWVCILQENGGDDSDWGRQSGR